MSCESRYSTAFFVNFGAIIIFTPLSIFAASLSISAETTTFALTKSRGFESIACTIASSRDFPRATALIFVPDTVTTALTSKNSLITFNPIVILKMSAYERGLLDE